MDDNSRPVASPCRAICTMDNKRGVCAGCGRTMTEIARWPTATEAERRAIIAAIALREAARRN